MNKTQIYALLSLLIGAEYASADSITNANQTFINPNSYYENPYENKPSGGDTQYLIESQTANHSLLEKLFSDGTWNVFTAATSNYSGIMQSKTSAQSNMTYGYGASLFGQTGRIGGFSFGGLITVDNPFFNSQLNGWRQDQAPFMTTKQLTQLNELYVEYQYSNRVQVDAGWISINNSPWLTPAATLNNMNPIATYQGAIVNVNPGGGWLLTVLGFNAAQLGGATGMSGYTMYNAQSNGPLPNGENYFSNNTVAIGGNYKALDNNYELRLWGYNYDNYGTLLYADSKLNINLTDKLSLMVGLQAGTDNGNLNGSTNAFVNYQNKTISSNFAGALFQVGYDWAQLGFAYNNIWGAQSAYGQGGIVAPYNVTINNDPLFAEAWMYNMANSGSSGTGSKVYSRFTFLDGNLWFMPVYGSYTSSNPIWNGTQEYDIQFGYSIPQIRGLSIFSILAYQILPSANPQAAARLGNQIYLSYTY